jgi:hypothetical protein
MFQIFIITTVLILISILILGFNIFFTKKGKFPETRIGHNKALRKKGIYCPRTLDTLDRKACNACEYFTMVQTSKQESKCLAPMVTNTIKMDN